MTQTIQTFGALVKVTPCALTTSNLQPLGWNIETEERPLGEAFAQAAELAVTAEETKQRVTIFELPQPMPCIRF